MMNTSCSPRGPSQELAAATTNAVAVQKSGDVWKQLSDDGYRAIKELERVLFLTDVKDNVAGETMAAEGFRAIQDLRRVLLFTESKDGDKDTKDKGQTPRVTTPSKGETKDPNLASNEEELGCTHIMCNTTSTDAPATPTIASSQQYSPSLLSSSSALVTPSATAFAMIDLLKSHCQSAFQEMEQTSHKALKDVERKLFFTDLDEATAVTKKNHQHKDGNRAVVIASSVEVNVFKEIELILQEVERKLSVFALVTGQPAFVRGHRVLKQMERSSQKAYKECERTLLFTDLDETALANDKTNDDVITHFLNSQEVFQEMSRKVFFSDIQQKEPETKRL